METLTPELAQQVGASSTVRGVVITDVDQSSPAADAGLGRGLIVTGVNRHPVTNAQDFKREMAQTSADKPVLLTVNQGGQTAFIVVQPK